MWIAGLLLLALGAYLFLSSSRAKDRANYMQATETSQVASVTELIDEIRAEIPGPGSSGYADAHEFKGRVSCDTPLVGEFSGKPAAIVNTRVEREIETLTEREDAEGNIQTEWVRSTDVMSSNRQETTFFIQDDTGRLRIDPTGSNLALIKVVNRFEPPPAPDHTGAGQATISISGFSLSVPTVADTHDRRTLGYRFVEEALPIGQSLYAYGEVVDTDNEGVLLRKPSDGKDRPYVLSTQSEEELVRAANQSAVFRKRAGVALAIGGAVLTVIGLLQ